VPSLSPAAKRRLGALLAAWVTLVFGTSAVIALLGLSPRANRGGTGFPGSAWEVADEMGPAAKLLLIAVFAAAVTLGTRLGGRSIGRLYAANAVLGAGAMVLTLLILPRPLSRGFGVGLTGARLDPAVLPVYVAGAVLAALVFTRLITVPRAGTGGVDGAPGTPSTPRDTR
jgi:hypothetical protein